MLTTYRALVCAQQPALNQGCNPMNAGHADVSRVAGIRNNNFVMFEAGLRQLVVALPPIGQNLGAPFSDVTNKRHQTTTRHIRYSAHSHASKTFWQMNFHRNSHNLLAFATSPSFAANIATANVGLIHFNTSAKQIPVRAHHCLPQLMQPCPSRLITPKAKNAFQSKGACPVLLAGHKPDRCEPGSQRHPCPMEDGSRSYRDLASALAAMKVAPACRPGFCTNATASTLETMWPTATKKIATASRFIGEPFQKLLIRARVVFSRYRNRAGAHAQSYYMQGVLASSGYPPFSYFLLQAWRALGYHPIFSQTLKLSTFRFTRRVLK